MINEQTYSDMRCIFCKKNSSNSKSVEHIIPESLGNIDHCLPIGIVCDTCNNYFGTKIEGPLLETPYFKNLRGRQSVPNKRGKCPPINGFLFGANIDIALYSYKQGGLSIEAYHEKENSRLIKFLLDRNHEKFIIPHSFPQPDKVLLSRFLAKVSLEVLAHRLHPHNGWEDQVIDHPELDPLRNYARYGHGVEYWPFYEREIYSENKNFDEIWQVMHEFDLLYTEKQELYVIICIFGTEYSINMGAPEIEGYEMWLKEHAYVSPLYAEKNKEVR
jgi:hypothetical protein